MESGGWILTHCIAAVLLHSGESRIHSGHFSSIKEVGSVSVKHQLVHDRQRRSTGAGAWPREIHTHISGGERHDVTGNYDVTLRFKALADGRVSPVVYRDDNGDRAEHFSEKSNCTRFYEDLQNGAHAMVDLCDEGFSMVAELYLDNGHHVILPKEGVSNGGGVVKSNSFEATHCLYSVDTSIDFLNDVRMLPATEQRNPEIRAKREATGSYTVELMIIIDYSLYDYWYKMTSSTASNAARKTEAMEMIQSFYTFISRGINFRYLKATDHNLDIGVELSQIYVLETLAKSSITVPANHVSGVRDVIDGERTLDNLKAWVADKRANEPGFPTVDHHMLLTDQDLAVASNQGSAGIALLKQICTIQSVSLVEGRFDFITAIIGAHELGHSLGGYHDGVGNACSSDDGYVLATVNSLKSGAEKDNPFRFSPCSIQSFVATIGDLDTSDSNCLLVNNVQSVVEEDGPPIGQLYQPDVQCQKVFGPSASMSRFHNNQDGSFEQMCTSMTCILSATSAQGILPADGTSCGNRKWCENGVCVQSNNAPAAIDEACLFGDHPGNLPSEVITCVNATTDNPAYCYQAAFRTQCCETCNDQKLAIQGCEYGDRQNCTSLNDYQCYNDTLADQCCKTCHDAKQRHSANANIPNCTYGDRFSNCGANVATNCRTNPIGCCETCASYLTTPPAGRTTQEPGKSDDLPEWVIPVAASAGGIIVIVLVSLLIYQLCVRRRSSPKHGRHGSRQKDKRRRSNDSRDRSYNKRDRSRSGSHDNRDRNYDNRAYHPSPDRYRRGSRDRGYNRY